MPIRLALIDPGEIFDHDVGIAHIDGPPFRCGLYQYERQRRQRIAPQPPRRIRIVIGIDAQFEFEAAIGIGGEIEDDGLEHRGVGHAQMIAIQRHHHRGAAGQADDAAFQIVDLHMVVGAEWLAQAEHQRRHIVLDRIAHRETQCDPDYARAAQHRPQQCRRADHVQRDNQPADHEYEADGAGNEFGQKRIRRDPAPQRAEPCNKVPDKSDAERHQDRRADQWQDFYKIGNFPGQIVERAQILANRKIALQIVLDRDHPADLTGKRLSLGYSLLCGDCARQGDDTLIRVYRHAGIGLCRPENTAQPFRDACIVAGIDLHFDGLGGRCIVRRCFGCFRRHRENSVQRRAQAGQQEKKAKPLKMHRR